MAEERKKITDEKEARFCSNREKLGHALGVLGHDSANTLWSTWMLPFMTDILLLPAQFLIILTTAARFFDAFTDISMGVIADRTRSKLGRFRPWILRAGPLFCLCVALSFLKLPIGVNGLCVFAGIMYVFTGSIAFTAVDIPFWSLPAAMTNNTTERSEIIGSTTTTSNLITGAMGIVMPLALTFLGEFKWTSYFYIALAVAIFATIMYFICFKLVREHVEPDNKERFSLKLALRNIFHNQPLLCIQLSNIFCLLALILRSYMNYYYCQYNLGNLEIMAVISIISTVGMVIGAILFTALTKKVGKKNCMYAIAIIYTVANLVLYLSGWGNLIVLYMTASVASIAIGADLVCINAMLADTIEYGEWKTGQRNEAMITSTRCFVTKCVAAVAGAFVLAAIGMTGFVPQAEAQADGVLTGFHFMYTLLTAIMMLLAVVPMFFYNLTEKRHAEIMEELAKRKEGNAQ